ncbi:MAG: hypothetical protein OZ928_05880 [Polyangiaceae bacterium]|nr:hypothetical protein [Polyangiaceae bacterium]
MVSSTQQTERRRKINSSRNGRDKKRARAKHSTQAFAVHPAGYDAAAPDARKSTQGS